MSQTFTYEAKFNDTMHLTKIELFQPFQSSENEEIEFGVSIYIYGGVRCNKIFPLSISLKGIVLCNKINDQKRHLNFLICVTPKK